jgi:hypothetical protein
MELAAKEGELAAETSAKSTMSFSDTALDLLAVHFLKHSQDMSEHEMTDVRTPGPFCCVSFIELTSEEYETCGLNLRWTYSHGLCAQVLEAWRESPNTLLASIDRASEAKVFGHRGDKAPIFHDAKLASLLQQQVSREEQQPLHVMHITLPYPSSSVGVVIRREKPLHKQG